MRIKTQIVITMLLFGVVLAVVSASAVITNQQVGETTRQEAIANRIAQGANELAYLSNDYLVYRESQQLSRWQSRYDSFSGDVASLQVDRPDQQALARNIQASQRRLKEVFDSVASAAASTPTTPNPTLDPSSLQVSWSRMAVQSQGLVSDASRLSQLLRNQADRARQMNMTVVLAMMCIFGAYFFVNYLIIQRRVLKSVAALRAGTSVIGSGELDFRIEERKNDEIGELPRAFNQMTANLKAVTASKTDMETEIAERKRAEQETSEHLRKTQLLSAFATHLLEPTPSSEIFQYAAQVLQTISGKAIIAVNEYDAAANRTILRALVGPEDKLQKVIAILGGSPVGLDFAVAEGTLRQMISGSLAHLEGGLNDLTFNPLPLPLRKQLEEELGLGEIYAMPFELGEDFIGTVAVLTDHIEGLRDRVVVEALVNQTGLALKRSRAEQALVQRTTELEIANRELESFSYSVAHDLRAPLRHIDGFSRVLLEDFSDGLDEQGRYYLHVVCEGSQRMALLIDDLLKLSRLTRTEMSIDKVDLSEIAESIGAVLKREQPERQVDLSVSPGMVAQGDARLLRIAVENLLANAWKFTSRRERAQIEFGIMESSDHPAYYVRDNGAGFDGAYGDRLFVPFQRLHNEADFPGTGVGLATVQRIIQRHGGRVWAEGEVDKGATFFFTLIRT